MSFIGPVRRDGMFSGPHRIDRYMSDSGDLYVMCCVCVEFFPLSALHDNGDGTLLDMCEPCFEAESLLTIKPPNGIID